MKNLIIICLLTIACDQNQRHDLKSDFDNCNKQELKSKMLKIEGQYSPTQIELNKTIENDTMFNNFLVEIDTNCLKGNSDFDTFSIRVLCKLQENHKLNYHQNFDLLPMRKGKGKLIIDAFCRISEINIENTEFLNFDYYKEKNQLDKKYKFE